ncbi:hypothetical protein UlMin_035608 [Ulmus minor]
MDKNKSRTDLLAAGRKKLQQFRQKKDNKGSGSHGKSSKKSGKSEHLEADAVSSAAKPPSLSPVPEGETASHVGSDSPIIESSTSSFVENLCPDIDVAVVDPTTVATTPDSSVAEIVMAHNGLATEAVGVNELDVDSLVQNEGMSTGTVDAEVVNSDTVNSGGETKDGNTSVLIDSVTEPASIDSEGVAVSAESQSVNSEDNSSSPEDLASKSLMLARGDQVTDVGAMQEANSLEGTQSNRCSVVEIEEDGKLPVSELGKGADTSSRVAFVDTNVNAPFEADQAGNVDEVSTSDGANTSDEFSCSGLTLSEADISGVSPAMEIQQTKGSLLGSFNGENPELSLGSGDLGRRKDSVQDDAEDSRVPLDNYEGPTETKLVSSSRESTVVSPVSDLNSISLSKLLELIEGLSEEEYVFLLKSREPVCNSELGASNLLPDHGVWHQLERLKEELFLTNCTKDIFQLQLSQQSELQGEFDLQRHQLVDEISLLNASLHEASKNNQSLSEELTHCRYELQAVASGRDELQNQLHASRAEIEEFSARSHELQNSLEKSQGDLLGLSTELADCRASLVALQVENENLNGTIASVTEERKKLSEEKDFHFQENEKLLQELSDCKSVITSLQLEISNLTTTLSSVAAEREMLEEEKERLFHEHDKVLTELADCKGAVSAMQVESAKLEGSFSIVTEERKQLEEDRKRFAIENERLSSELLVLQEQLSSEQRKREGLDVDLKEATLRIEQLMEENIFLSNSLDINKAKIIEADGNRIEIAVEDREVGDRVQTLEVQNRDNASAAEDSYQIPGKQDDVVSFTVVQKHQADGFAGRSHVLLERVFDASFGFKGLKGHLEEAGKILYQLEKAIEGVHALSAFDKPGGKLPAPGVSKLIQAFESKVHVEELDAEGRPLSENKSSVVDPFILMKVEMGNLRALFERLIQDAADAGVMFKGEQDCRETANITIKELKDQCEDLQEHSNILEATSIELAVLCEVVKHHGNSIGEANNELVDLYEACKQEVAILKTENSDLVTKLCAYESRITELQSHLYDLQQTSSQTVAVISNNLEDLQKEVSERVSILEQDRNSTVYQLVEVVQKFDELVGNSSSLISLPQDGLDVVSLVAASINASTKVIKDLQKKLEAAQTDHEVICMSFKEVSDRCGDLQQNNDLALGILYKIHVHFRKLLPHLHGYVDETEMNLENEKLLDPLDYSNYGIFFGELENLLSERLELESVNKKLNFELTNKTGEFEELNRGYLNSNALFKLIEDVKGVLQLESTEIHLDKSPASLFESLVSILVQKYKEAVEEVGFSREQSRSRVMNLTALQEEIQQLTALCLQHETETFVLKESLNQVKEALSASGSELQKKVRELEQSEQRVSSIREKLSIAVTKGKGLIVQRDGLKQSLAETSSELERCLQELQLKDTRLHEVETKLKAYSEAGERVEALESELSYIRNSATALRESFLLKDSVLQRIEEILEDLDLPEHFHSRDIIEKVDWLARSATGNLVPPTDWDQKSSGGGGSYSDAGFVMMEPWKEDVQSSSNSVEDLKRKYEELQSKFYGLAEQNEMLEQSLMERNNLVQKWEELLDRIDMPSQLRSVEPEDRIEWLGRALSEAHHDAISLQQKVVNFESYCGSMNADLEDSRRRISDLNTNLESVTRDREHLSERLEILSHNLDTLSVKAAQFEDENRRLQHEVASLQENNEQLSLNASQFEVENRKLQNEVTSLQENNEHLLSKASQFEVENKKLQNEVASLNDNGAKMLENEKQIINFESEIRRLQSLVSDVLQDYGMQDQVSGGSSIECFEGLLKKLLENYATSSLVKPLLGGGAVGELHSDVMLVEERSVGKLDAGESDVAILKKELEEALHELIHVKEERDGYAEKQQSLGSEIETLVKKREELELLLNQEEQKSASVREKLNVAVRKGKSLVQQRDSLKQTIEEMNGEMENLKSQIKIWENKLSEYEQKLRDLSAYPERVEVLESENLFLRNRFTESKHHLQETGNTLSTILSTLVAIDVGDGVAHNDPIKKLEQIAKLCSDLRSDAASSEQEWRKSRRAAELLLAELNEVQERNDGLQEELANAADELARFTKERDLAQTAKLEALSHLENLHNVHSLEKRNQFSEFMGLKSFIDQLRKSFNDISYVIADVFTKDLEFLHNLESGIGSCIKPSGATDVVNIPLFNEFAALVSSNSNDKVNFSSTDSWLDSNLHGDFDGNFTSEIYSSVGHELQELMVDVGMLKEKLNQHSSSLHEQAHSLSKLIVMAHREILSRNESHEAMKRDILHLESTKKEKDEELLVLHKHNDLLVEALSNSVTEIENAKAAFLGNNWTAGDLGINLKSATFHGGFSGQGHISSEDSIRTMVDKLLLAVRDFASMKAETVEGSQKQMKNAITDLQKELQEKEIQKERICMDLVQQIKEAEAASARYSIDLQSSRNLVGDLEKQVEAMERERYILEQRIKELEDSHTNSTELQQRVRSLTDLLASKDQEIEALMQALDEEESQMEDLKKKLEKLEMVVQQKNLDLGNSEASRGKAMKKLSITVSKFDELHQLSASLLAEVERLQSQLQDRDGEISFLRQEVTRCTNEVLVASQISNKKDSDDIQEFLAWFDVIIANVGIHNLRSDKNDHVHEGKDLLKKKIELIVSELVDLREVAQSKDALLQAERNTVDELRHKEEILEKSLRDKESRLNLLEGVGPSELATSEISEVEPLINKWTVPGASTTSQVRSLRKGNTDQVAIAIDMEPGTTNRLEDEDDDKVHGFKSLTTSRIVPRFTRPVTDMIDGLWVSCDRALMRQPALRLCIILYWAILHSLLASFAI